MSERPARDLNLPPVRMELQQAYGLVGDGCDVCQRSLPEREWYVLALPLTFPQAVGMVVCGRCIAAATQCLATRPPPPDAAA